MIAVYLLLLQKLKNIQVLRTNKNQLLISKININNPTDCLNLTFKQSVDILKNKIGEEAFQKAFNIDSFVKSPVADFNDTSWCKTLKIIGTLIPINSIYHQNPFVNILTMANFLFLKN